MSLATQQNFIAQLFIDETLRLSFADAPQQVGAENGLSDDEISEINLTLNDDFEFFAKSLINKRLLDVKKLLPLSLQTLSVGEFNRRFHEFAKSHMPAKPFNDAVRFARFLTDAQTYQSWQMEMIKLERARLLFNNGKQNLFFKVFGYELTSSGQTDGPAAEPRKKRTLFLWIRCGKWVRRFAW